MADALETTHPTASERLERALQNLENHVRGGGNMVGKNAANLAEIQNLNKTELEGLRTENAILKDKQNSLKTKLDKTIHHIESILEKSS